MNEEKLMILRMLKDGKITEEEASKLLDALNFKSESANSQSNDSNYTDNLMDKVSSTVEAAIAKASQAINSINFEDINFDFSNAFYKGKLSSRYEKTEKIKVDDPEDYHIAISNVNGGIKLMSGNEDEIGISYEIMYDEKTVKSLDELVIIENDGNYLKVETKKNLFKNSERFAVNFVISLPDKMFKEIEIDNKNGSIDLYFIKAKEIVVKSTNGKIIANYINADSFDANSVNGEIIASFDCGKDLKLRTVNGKITVDNPEFSTIDCNTVNGGISLKSIGDIISKISLKNINGGINIDLNEVVKPTKVELKCPDRRKYSNILNERFTDIKSTKGKVSATTFDYTEGGDNTLDVYASCINGKIIIS